MKFLSKVGFFVFSIGWAANSLSAGNETTTSQIISQFLYNGISDHTYFTSTVGWGAPSCPNAIYAEVMPDLPGKKEMLAIGYAAKLSGTPVKFMGSCNPGDSNYFTVTYIFVG